MIYTTYFAKLRSLPEHIVPISIAGKAPVWYKGFECKQLAPKYGFFQEWKKTGDNDYYVEHYLREVLDDFDPHIVASELHVRANSGFIALVCYEKPGDFCHRHLVAEWLNEAGIRCEEWDGNEKTGD